MFSFALCFFTFTDSDLQFGRHGCLIHQCVGIGLYLFTIAGLVEQLNQTLWMLFMLFVHKSIREARNCTLE